MATLTCAVEMSYNESGSTIVIQYPPEGLIVKDSVNPDGAQFQPGLFTFSTGCSLEFNGKEVALLTVSGAQLSYSLQNTQGNRTTGNTTTTASGTLCYNIDTPAEPVTLTFPQPEEGNNKISQVRVSVNDGPLSTTSPVEIPAGGTANVQYSYQPFDEYLGPVINQPVSITTNPWEVVITPVVENMFYTYYSTADDKTTMTINQEYRIPTFVTNESNYLIIGLTYENKDFNFMYAAHLNDGWALYGPGSNQGHLVCRVISLNPQQTTYTIGDFADSISVNVVHENTTTPEVQ